MRNLAAVSDRTHWDGSELARHISYSFHDATYMERHRMELRSILDGGRVPRGIRKNMNAVYATSVGGVPLLDVILDALNTEYKDISMAAKPSDVSLHARLVAALQAMEELSRTINVCEWDGVNGPLVLWDDPMLWSCDDEHRRPESSVLGKTRRPTFFDDEDRNAFELNNKVETRADARRRCLHMMHCMKDFLCTKLHTREAEWGQQSDANDNKDMRRSITMRGSISMCNWDRVYDDTTPSAGVHEGTLAMAMLAQNQERTACEFSTDFTLNASALDFPLTGNGSCRGPQRSVMRRLRYIYCIIWDVWLRVGESAKGAPMDGERVALFKKAPDFFYCVYCAIARAAFSCQTYRPRAVSDVTDFVINDVQRYADHIEGLVNTIIDEARATIEGAMNKDCESESESDAWDSSVVIVPITFGVASRVLTGAVSRLRDHLKARERMDSRDDPGETFDDASSSRSHTKSHTGMRRQRSESHVPSLNASPSVRRTSNSSGELKMDATDNIYDYEQERPSPLDTLAESPTDTVALRLSETWKRYGAGRRRRCSYGTSKRSNVDNRMAEEVILHIKRAISRFEEEALRRSGDAFGSAFHTAGVMRKMRPSMASVTRTVKRLINMHVAKKNAQLGNGRARQWVECRKASPSNDSSMGSPNTRSTASSSSASSSSSRPIAIPSTRRI